VLKTDRTRAAKLPNLVEAAARIMEQPADLGGVARPHAP
jgi:hypothetical protein